MSKAKTPVCDVQHNFSRVSLTRCESYDSAALKAALRRLFYLLGLDEKNPLGCLIRPGDKVVLKPNWVKECHEHNANEWQSVITHPSIIDNVLEFVLIALNGRGNVTIMDGPQTDSSFAKILSHMQADRWIMKGHLYGVRVDLLDLREDEWVAKGGIVVKRHKLPGDPKGSIIADLKEESSFSDKPVPSLGYYGADYMCDETTWAHSEGRNLYKVSRTAVDGDVFINLPKMKTHGKAGITACMKNLVGINTYKNYLPHHAQGTPAQGGDQYPCDSRAHMLESSITARLKTMWGKYPSTSKYFIPVKYLGGKIFGDSSKILRSGAWHGNDTLWRMVIDLNKVLLYANSDNTLRESNFCSTKRYFALVDAITAGEGLGPMAHDVKNARMLMAGFNPLAVDCVAAKMMGFDYRKVLYLKNAFDLVHYPIANFTYEDISVHSDHPALNRCLKSISALDTDKFRPAPGWAGHIEEEYSD